LRHEINFNVYNYFNHFHIITGFGKLMTKNSDLFSNSNKVCLCYKCSLWLNIMSFCAKKLRCYYSIKLKTAYL